MSIEIPGFLSPVLWYYGLANYWPGIDEDAVLEWGEEAVAWVDLVESFASEVVNLLGELGENTETESLVAFRESVEDLRSQHLDPYVELVKTAIPTACNMTWTTVTAAKSGVIGVLVANVASDIPIIMSGVGLPFIAAKRALMSALIQTLLAELIAVAVAELTQVATAYIEVHWLDDQRDRWAVAIGDKVAEVVNVDVSTAGGGAAGTLVVSSADVIGCVSRIGVAVHKFQDSMRNAGLAEISEQRIADYRVAGASKLIPIAVAELLDWGMMQLRLFAVDLAAEILDSLSEMLNHADETLTEAERTCQVEAESLRMELQTLRPVGVANSTAGRPDFFAPVREAYGIGVAGSGAGATTNLDPPVAATRGTGPARAEAQDLSVLDAPTAVTRGAGTARGGAVDADLDSVVDAVRGVGRSDSVSAPAPQDLEDEVTRL